VYNCRAMRKYLVRIAVPLVYFILGIVMVYLGWRPEIVFSWETVSEVDTAGFVLYRSDLPIGPFSPIVETPIPAKGDPLVGASYEYTDRDVVWGQRYFYRLEEVERSGNRNTFPQVVDGRAGAGWTWALAAGALLATVGGVIGWYATRDREQRPAEDGEKQHQVVVDGAG
jgi:hypothetical protein